MSKKRYNDKPAVLEVIDKLGRIALAYLLIKNISKCFQRRMQRKLTKKFMNDAKHIVLGKKPEKKQKKHRKHLRITFN